MMQHLPGGIRVSFIPTTVGMVTLSPGIIPPPTGGGGPGPGAVGIIIPFLLALLPFLAPVLVAAPTPAPVVSPAPPSVPPSAGPAAVVPAPIVLPSAQQRPPAKLPAKPAAKPGAKPEVVAQVAAKPQQKPARTVLPYTGAVAAGFLIPGGTLLALGIVLRSHRIIRSRPSQFGLASEDPSRGEHDHPI